MAFVPEVELALDVLFTTSEVFDVNQIIHATVLGSTAELIISMVVVVVVPPRSFHVEVETEIDSHDPSAHAAGWQLSCRQNVGW